jgi:putative hydrolase of the HAD superfamily
MPAYQHIFFDLDHTLWDFERCSCETLEELFETYQLSGFAPITLEKFVETFRTINRSLWTQYSSGQISQQELRKTRFIRILNELNIADASIAQRLADEYIRLCPLKPHLLPYAREVLEYLQDKYVLHIITNGFADIQSVKMQSASITGFFKEIITSEKAGCQKPNRKIFDYALQQTKAHPKHCIMIGDSLDSDIQGAINAEIDHVFFNYEHITHQATPTYEIKCLSELKQLL